MSGAGLYLHAKELKKTGSNNGKPFFELGDFLPEAIVLMNTAGLCGICSFTTDIASLTITDVDDNSSVVITIPMGTADLKGCHVVQNIGASVTYERRYLWMTALDIIEHDGLDALRREEFDITPYITAIEACTDLEALKTAFAAAEKAAKDVGDKGALNALTGAKNAKGAAIQKAMPMSEEKFQSALAKVKSGAAKIEAFDAYTLTDRQQGIIADMKAAQE